MANQEKKLLDKLPLKAFCTLLILLGLLAGLVNVFPYLLIKGEVERQGNLYLPIQADSMFSDEALWYMPISKKIIENYGAISDFFFKQYEKIPAPIPSFPNYIYAPLFLFSRNVSQIFLAGIFFFSVVLFFAYYLLGKIFFLSRTQALFFASLTGIACYPIRNFSSFLISLVDSTITFATSGNFAYITGDILGFLSTIKVFVLPISSTLPINLSTISLTDPLITYLIYIPAIAGLLHFFLKPNKRSAVISGILIGLLFHSYLYYAIVLSVVVFLYLIYAFSRRQREELNKILILSGIILFFLLIYAASLYKFYQLPQAHEIARRIGSEHGFGFRWIVWREYVVYVVFFVLNWLVFKNTQPKKYLFYSFVFVSMFICYNLQMIFGFMPHPDHWARTFSPLLYIFFFDLVLSWLYFNRTAKRKFVLDAAVLVFIILFFFTAAANFTRFRNLGKDDTAFNINQFTFDKDIYKSYQWADHHPGKYISPSFLTTYYLILYTQASPHLASAANSMASNHELEQRFLETLKVWNVPYSRLQEILTDRTLNSDISLNLYINYYSDQSFNYSLVEGSGRGIPAQKVEELLQRYEKIEIDPNDYKGYYLYDGPFERKLFGDFLPGEITLEKMYSNDKVVIYKII